MPDPQSDRPVFVVGASRSGTALLRSALNKSGAVFVAGETHYFDDLRPRLGAQATASLDAQNRTVCEDYFLALSHRPYGHGGQADRARLERHDLRRLADELGSTGDAYLQAYCRLSVRLEEPAVAECDRWGEKTPRHVFRLADILTRYPSAQVVAMFRDPRAVAASYAGWRQQGGLRVDGDEGYEDSLAAEEERARASYDPSVLSLLWRATVKAGTQAVSRFGASRVMLVRYEDLVTDPGTTLKAVSAFLGVPFDERMLDVPMHNSSFTRFDTGSGVSTEPVQRWKKTLPTKDAVVVEHWCKDGLDALGYERTNRDLGLKDTATIWASVPVAGVRAVWANRERAGKMPSYVWRRLRLMRGA